MVSSRIEKRRVKVAKVSTSNCLLLGGMGGWRQGYSESNEVVIRERKGGVGEVARVAEMGEYKVKGITIGVSGSMCPLG